MSERDDAGILGLLEAMFDGQKRMLGMVEAAIDKFNAVETEIAKLNREVNTLHEITIRNHSETSRRLEVISSRIEDAEPGHDESAGQVF